MSERAARRCGSTRRSSSRATTAAGCTCSPASTCRRTRRAACSTTSPPSAPTERRARAAPESVVAYRWLTEFFQPSIATVPADLRGKREPAELFHEILEHRWFLSEAAQRDVGTRPRRRSYVEEVLRHRPDEKAVLELDDEDDL